MEYFNNQQLSYFVPIIIITHPLSLENLDNFFVGLWTGHHSVCGHFSQVTREILTDFHWFLWFTGANQLVVCRIDATSPCWTVTFDRKRWCGLMLGFCVNNVVIVAMNTGQRQCLTITVFCNDCVLNEGNITSTINKTSTMIYNMSVYEDQV